MYRGGYSTRTITFPVITARETLHVECKECGKPLKRVVRVSHTQNPFNKNAAGEMKSRSEVYADATAELEMVARKKLGEQFECRDCEITRKVLESP